MKDSKVNPLGMGFLVLINADHLVKNEQVQLVSYDDAHEHIKLEKKVNEQLHLALQHINAGNQIVPVVGIEVFKNRQKFIHHLCEKMVNHIRKSLSHYQMPVNIKQVWPLI